jgi:uncharacterized protein YcaQ
VTEPTCALCRHPISAAAARARGVGGRCWWKLSPAQRAAIRADPTRARAVITRPVPGAGQLALTDQENSP